MHEEWVEPSKKVADLIVHSNGHSMDVAVQMLTNHMRISAGIDTPPAATAEAL
jgi:uridine kinase